MSATTSTIDVRGYSSARNCIPIINNLCMSKEIRDIAQKLINNKKPGACTYWIRLVGMPSRNYA
ncbi:1946_t:CDS:2, partial [Diversispora eburnea]